MTTMAQPQADSNSSELWHKVHLMPCQWQRLELLYWRQHAGSINRLLVKAEQQMETILKSRPVAKPVLKLRVRKSVDSTRNSAASPTNTSSQQASKSDASTQFTGPSSTLSSTSEIPTIQIPCDPSPSQSKSTKCSLTKVNDTSIRHLPAFNATCSSSALLPTNKVIPEERLLDNDQLLRQSSPSSAPHSTLDKGTKSVSYSPRPLTSLSHQRAKKSTTCSDSALQISKIQSLSKVSNNYTGKTGKECSVLLLDYRKVCSNLSSSGKFRHSLNGKVKRKGKIKSSDQNSALRKTTAKPRSDRILIHSVHSNVCIAGEGLEKSSSDPSYLLVEGNNEPLKKKFKMVRKESYALPVVGLHHTKPPHCQSSNSSVGVVDGTSLDKGRSEGAKKISSNVRAKPASKEHEKEQTNNFDCARSKSKPPKAFNPMVTQKPPLINHVIGALAKVQSTITTEPNRTAEHGNSKPSLHQVKSKIKSQPVLPMLNSKAVNEAVVKIPDLPQLPITPVQSELPPPGNNIPAESLSSNYEKRFIVKEGAILIKILDCAQAPESEVSSKKPKELNQGLCKPEAKKVCKRKIAEHGEHPSLPSTLSKAMKSSVAPLTKQFPTKLASENPEVNHKIVGSFTSSTVLKTAEICKSLSACPVTGSNKLSSPASTGVKRSPKLAIVSPQPPLPKQTECHSKIATDPSKNDCGDIPQPDDGNKLFLSALPNKSFHPYETSCQKVVIFPTDSIASSTFDVTALNFQPRQDTRLTNLKLTFSSLTSWTGLTCVTCSQEFPKCEEWVAHYKTGKVCPMTKY